MLVFNGKAKNNAPVPAILAAPGFEPNIRNTNATHQPDIRLTQISPGIDIRVFTVHP